MPYYKVLRKRLDHFVSSNAWFGYEVYYKEGEWAHPHAEWPKEGFGLFVYHDKLPIEIEDKLDVFAVYECEIGEILPLPEFRLLIQAMEFCNLRLLKGILTRRPYGTVVQHWPENTINTTKVKLTKRLTKEDILDIRLKNEEYDVL